MPVTINRDPFARTETIRETVRPAARERCAWCGSAPGRFRYGTETDGGTRGYYPGAFCGIGCFRSHADTR